MISSEEHNGNGFDIVTKQFLWVSGTFENLEGFACRDGPSDALRCAASYDGGEALCPLYSAGENFTE